MQNEFSIVIAGDTIPSEEYVRQFEAGNISELFDSELIEVFKNADFSILNLEGALTDSDDRQIKVGPVIKTSRKAVNGFKSLGVKAVALANNHFTDYKNKGCEDTITTLEDASIFHVGGGSAQHEINPSISITLGSRKVCIYNVSESFFNVSDGDSGVNIYDEYLVCEEIKRLKEENDYLIVIYHGGAEMFPYPTPMVRKRFHRMADCGADFITAQHTHCIGCEELYNKSRLLYGQGNFFFPKMKSQIARKGLVTTITFSGEKTDISHRCVAFSSGRMVLGNDSDMAGFHERSKELANGLSLMEKYEAFIDGNHDLKSKYYRAFSGTSMLDKLLFRISQSLYFKSVEKRHSGEQLSRIVFSMESDRMREDVTILWKNLLKKL